MREQGRIAYKARISAAMGPWSVGGSFGWVNPLDGVLEALHPGELARGPGVRQLPSAQPSARLSSVDEDQAYPRLLVVAWRALALGCRDAVEVDVFQEMS